VLDILKWIQAVIFGQDGIENLLVSEGLRLTVNTPDFIRLSDPVSFDILTVVASTLPPFSCAVACLRWVYRRHSCVSAARMVACGDRRLLKVAD
jgi:hypothetical protein